MLKPVLLTGFRPTGELHLGHYFSLIEPLFKAHRDHEIYVLIADLHALTEFRKASKIDLAGFSAGVEASIHEAVRTISTFVPADNLIIFRQSDLKHYHLDLFFRLLMISRHNLTFGNPVFQEAIRSEYEKDINDLKLSKKNKSLIKEFVDAHPELLWAPMNNRHASTLQNFLNMEGDMPISNMLIEKIMKHLNTRIGVMGLASYPLLMAADILLYAPDKVLVGKDQSPHIQITNDIVKILNNTFNTTIPTVEPMISREVTLKGNDGVKMSKSLNNHLPINNLLRGKHSLDWFMKLRTFPRLRDQVGDPDQCIMHDLAQYFGKTECDSQAAGCRLGLVGCVDCKRMMNDMVRKWFEQKRYRIPCSGCEIDDILKMGKARAEARIAQNEKILSILI